MNTGDTLKPDILYYTKDGRGKVIKWNLGYVLYTHEDAIIDPYLTATQDVWCAGGISRHINDIAETKEDAKYISYPNRKLNN